MGRRALPSVPFVSSAAWVSWAALAFVACAAPAPAAPPAVPSVPQAPSVASAPPAASAPTAAPLTSASPPTAAIEPPRTFIDETRATLGELVAVDTSHGRETDLLRPVEERLRAVGLAVDLVESAPGRGNLVARYRGTGAKKPLLLIAHVDVVPVEGQPWTVPPFVVTEKDGFLWGRGVNDDKGMAAVIVAIALEMARTRPVLSRDVVFALTAGEEVGGFAGAEWLAKNHPELIKAEIALNEGAGERLDEAGQRVVEVGLGVAEKTFQSYRLTVKGKGGHSSIPPTDSDPVLTLSRALVKIGEHRFPARVLPVTRQQLAEGAKLEKAPIAEAEARVAATGKVSAEDERVLSKDRVVNAYLRTTCVTTQLQASPQDNVLPASVEAVVNCRILPDETREQTQSTLARVVGDPTVAITPTGDFGYGPYSPLEGDVPAAARKVAQAIWPSAAFVPSMGTGATDSRHLRAIGVLSYGVGVSPATKAETLSGHTAHGADERRPDAWLADGARFLHELTYELAK